MPDTTHDASRAGVSLPDRDPDWVTRAVAATSLRELREIAAAARAAGTLTERDQAWCRALAGRLADTDWAAMTLLVRELGAEPVTGNGS